MKFFFCDLDDTLAFKELPTDDKEIDVDHGFYLAQKNLDKINQLISNEVQIGLITTRALPDEPNNLLEKLPYKYASFDHGTYILIDKEPDNEWLKTLEQYIGTRGREKKGLLWDFKQKLLKEMGEENYDIVDRFGSFRVKSRFMPEKTIDVLLQRTLPEGISRMVVNQDVDFYPTLAGKANSIKHILQIKGIPPEQYKTDVAYAGNANSDIESLGQFYSLTHSGANDLVKSIVTQNGGYVSPYIGHKAAADIISHVEAKLIQDTPQ